MANSLKDYFDALERLKSGKPVNVPKGTKISKDSVSLEAGRKKGSIKRSRPMFAQLIEAIEAMSKAANQPRDDMLERLAKAQDEAKHYRRLWEEGLGREISLYRQLMGPR